MARSQPPTSSLPVVVIVDDDEAVLGSLKFAFEIEGFAVRAYSTWNEVFDDAGFANCTCLIIDHKVPGLDGLGLIAALRTGRIAAPVVLITNQPTRGLRERAAKAGVPIVEKPLLAKKLLERVRDAIACPSRMH